MVSIGMRIGLRLKALFLGLGIAVSSGWSIGTLASGLTAEKIRAFCDGRGGKYLYTDGDNDLYVVDFASQDLKQVRVFTGPVGPRPKFSSDGQWVAFVSNGAARILPLETPGSSPRSIAPGDWQGVYWWDHPGGNRYLLMCGKNGVFAQEIGAQGEAKGARTKFFDSTEADGGISPDGRYVGSANGQGMYELKPPYLSVSDRKVERFYFMDEGYCNAWLASGGPGSWSYGYVLYMEGGHTRFTISKSDKSIFRHFGTPELIDATAKEWHGTGWSTDPDFGMASTIRNRFDKAGGNAWIVHLSKRPSVDRFQDIKYGSDLKDVKQAFLQITEGGGKTPHLWLAGNSAGASIGDKARYIAAKRDGKPLILLGAAGHLGPETGKGFNLLGSRRKNTTGWRWSAWPTLER